MGVFVAQFKRPQPQFIPEIRSSSHQIHGLPNRQLTVKTASPILRAGFLYPIHSKK